MKLIKSLYQSFKQAFIDNENVQSLEKKYSHTFNFLKRRVDRTKLSGLPLTIFSIALIGALLLFLGSIEDYLFSEIIIKMDVRINALLYAFRTAKALKVFIWITLLGESPTIIIFTLIISSLLWMARKKWQIVTLWLTIVGSEGLTFFIKLIFHRPRPLNAVFLEDSNSFPSGHSTIAVAFYGFLTYLAFRKIKSKLLRALIIVITLIIILAIGFSRLYLGVHYVSDVWTGYLVGLLWLIIGIGLSELKPREIITDNNQQKSVFKYQKTITAGLAFAALAFYVSFGLAYHPKFLPKTPATVVTTEANTINIFDDNNWSRYTETLTGDPQEPINFIIAAKDDSALVSAFKKSGWSLADPITFFSIINLAKDSLLNRAYETAPMTPSFWNKTIHNFGFEKSTPSISVRQRHHARFWKTNLITKQGDNIYFGTISLDIGIKWLITHKISPDLDTERELLFADLQKNVTIENFDKIKLVDPILGKNFIGDQFFTDGKAYFINFSR